MFYPKLRVLPGGDAAGGFLIDIHDGQNSTVYNPQGVGNTDEAVAAALADHAKAFPDAPTESDYVPQENGYPAPAASDANADQTTNADAVAAADVDAEPAPQAEDGAAPAASDANSQSAESPQA